MTRRIVGKGVICSLLLLAATAAVHSQTAAVSSDPVMRAMVNELERSVNELQFKDLGTHRPGAGPRRRLRVR